MQLQEFNFTIEHRKGSDHGNADGMSRVPVSRRRRCEREECIECESQPVKPVRVVTTRRGAAALAEKTTVVEPESVAVDPTPVEETGGVGRKKRQNLKSKEKVEGPNWLEEWSVEELRSMQQKDKAISRVLVLFESHDSPPGRAELLAESEVVRVLCTQWGSLRILGGLLYRVWRPKYEIGEKLQLVAPLGLQGQIFQQLHSVRTGGHHGVRKTLKKIRSRFFWPRFKADVQRWCQRCITCQRVKAGPGHRALLQQSPVRHRLDRVALDILGELPETREGNKYIVVISDYYTKWTHAVALKDQTALTVADALMTEFIAVVGVPRQIHTDQGRNFESHLFRHLCDLLHIEKTRTTPFHAQSDGQVERWNRTLQQMLKSFVNEHRNDWDDHLPYLCMAYRATPHDSTGCSPNLMMFGAEVNMPLDVMVGSPGEAKHEVCPTEYVEWLKRSLGHSYEYASQQLSTSAERQKHYYDLRSKPTQYRKGDFVWRWYFPAARGKLNKGWVGPFEVVDTPSPIHCVIRKSPHQATIRVHVDALKHYYGPIPDMWRDETEERDD